MIITDYTYNCANLTTTDASGNEEITGVEIKLYATHTFCSDNLINITNSF